MRRAFSLSLTRAAVRASRAPAAPKRTVSPSRRMPTTPATAGLATLAMASGAAIPAGPYERWLRNWPAGVRAVGPAVIRASRTASPATVNQEWLQAAAVTGRGSAARRSVRKREWVRVRPEDLSVRSRVAFFQREAALSPFDDRPESGAFHGLAGWASPTVLECGAGHLDTVLLLGQLGQLAIDGLLLALPLACDETPDLSQRKPDLAKEDDHADVADCRRSITPASRRPCRRPHQSELVVVPQRRRRNPGTFGQLANRQGRRRDR